MPLCIRTPAHQLRPDAVNIQPWSRAYTCAKGRFEFPGTLSVVLLLLVTPSGLIWRLLARLERRLSSHLLLLVELRNTQAAAAASQSNLAYSKRRKIGWLAGLAVWQTQSAVPWLPKLRLPKLDHNQCKKRSTL